MHRDILAYVEDCRKRRSDQEFSMFVKSVLKPNLGKLSEKEYAWSLMYEDGKIMGVSIKRKEDEAA